MEETTHDKSDGELIAIIRKELGSSRGYLTEADVALAVIESRLAQHEAILAERDASIQLLMNAGKMAAMALARVINQ